MLSIRGGLTSGLSWLLLGACGGTVVTSGEHGRDPNTGSGGTATGTFDPGKPGAGAVDTGRPGPIASGGTVSSPPSTGLISAGGTTSTGGSFAAGGFPMTPPGPPGCNGDVLRDPGGPATVNQGCCSTSLGATGTCTVPVTIPEGTLMKDALGHDTCDRTLVCAPNVALLEANRPTRVLDKCVSGAGVTGRCLPKCLVGGITQPMLQETCTSPEDVCAPCYDRIDGTPTGVCSLATGDSPPQPAPTPYRPCGSFDAGAPGGLCVPKSVVDSSGNALASTLRQDDCPLATDRCVPTAKAKDPAACLPRCTTTLTALGKQYGPGACVPSYVVLDTNPTSLVILKRDTCADSNALCTPCLDPLSAPVAGVPTHYCE